jgi:inner membrane protein
MHCSPRSSARWYALVMVPCARYLRAPAAVAFAFLFISMASHGALDAMTNRGYGVALLWPFSDGRFFFDFRPIETSPISVERFLSSRGMEVIRTELLWVWLPLSLLAASGYAARRRWRSTAPAGSTPAAPPAGPCE